MLIHIDASAIEDLVHRGDTAETSLRCLENLFRAHDGRKHIVSLGVREIKALEPLAHQFSAAGRTALSHMVSHRSEIAGLRREVPYHVELGLGQGFDGKSRALGEQHVIRADLHYFDDYERCGRAVLVAEGIHDIELYQALGVLFATSKRWQTDIVFEQRLGGGSTIGPVFAHVVRDGRIALAVADNDREYPHAGLGETAKGLLDVPCTTDLQRRHVLHVRAIENLIPFALYEEAMAPHARSPSIPEALLMLERAVPRHRLPWKAHANLKTGLLRVDVEAFPAGPEEEFWSDVARAAQRDRCRAPDDCRAAGGCACFVVEGLGVKALARAVEWIREQRPERLARMFALDADPDVTHLAALLASWGCALPQRVRA